MEHFWIQTLHLTSESKLIDPDKPVLFFLGTYIRTNKKSSSAVIKFVNAKHKHTLIMLLIVNNNRLFRWLSLCSSWVWQGCTKAYLIKKLRNIYINVSFFYFVFFTAFILIIVTIIVILLLSFGSSLANARLRMYILALILIRFITGNLKWVSFICATYFFLSVQSVHPQIPESYFFFEFSCL